MFRNVCLSLFLIVAVAMPTAAAEASDISWTGELPVALPRPGPSGGGDLSVAFNGEIHFAAWNRGDDVFGVRVAKDGTLLDPVPFLISESKQPNRIGGVVWNGERFLVIWRSYYSRVVGRYVSALGELEESVVFRDAEYVSEARVASNGSTTLVMTGSSPLLVRRDGSVLSPGPAAGFGAKVLAAVATDGLDYVVALEDYHGNPKTQIGLVRGETGTGELVEELPPMRWPQVMASSNGYLVFSGGMPLTATPLDRSGKVSGDPQRLSDEVADLARVSSLVKGDGSVLTVWQARRSYDVAGPTMLTTIDANGVRPPVSLGPEGFYPVLSGNELAPMLFWQGKQSIRHGRLDLVGLELVSNDSTSNAASAQNFPAIAPTRTGYFAVWNENSMSLRAAVLSRRLTAGPDFIVAEGVHRFSRPAVVAGSRVVLVVWKEFGDQGSRLLARRYDMSGNALDPVPVSVSQFEAVQDDSPAVHWSGSTFVVAWGGTQRVRVNRITEAGAILDGDGRIVAESMRAAAMTRPSIAANEDGLLLVWQDGAASGQCTVSACPDPPPPARIEGIVLSGDGVPRVTTQTVLTNELEGSPSVSARAGEMRLAWSSLEAGGRVVTATVRIVDDRPVLDAPVVVGSTDSYEPIVGLTAFDDGFLVAWVDGFAVRAVVIASSGMPGDPWELAPPTSRGWLEYGTGPAVTSRDGDAVVLYSRWLQEVGGAARILARGLPQPETKRRGVRR